jgi:hypothetical protein
MGLSLHTRATALVASLSIAAAVIVTVAEIGHPPPEGAGMIASLLDSMSARPTGGDAQSGTQVAAEAPQP